MKILITSGGTKVPIDPVRDITNMSHGTFGSKIATEALNQGHNVFYLVSKDGRSPFLYSHDFNLDDNELAYTGFLTHQKWCQLHRTSYEELRYRNFDDYAAYLKIAIEEYRPDIIILAAAVSDYVADASDSKIRSSDDLTIRLKKAEKIIGNVKKWAPNAFLVGFKLLVGEPYEKLLEAAKKSIEVNGCDLVVANEFNALKSGNHHIMLVDSSDNPKIVTTDMASVVVKQAVDRKNNV